ncbi:transcriptional regulator with XRE-family HTH domain [Kutzneria kofuensis]|uniref:Transcriptional regulator with XRE-family HTH domain n=1 Tax=Kutzneria kofuensis TaxID=103725 RepID=A0A7W9KG15_9PSEU|nr:transcriptional regulator with XRE-family HTH domain [Kutzneria kofuensis]
MHALTIVRIDPMTYQRVLGDELRKLRKQRGWTRKVLQGKLQTEVSLQTLATYELGTRQCSVVRLAEICLALDAMPHDLLARVHGRIFTDAPGEHIRLELSRVVEDAQPELLPLRRWARDRLRAANARTAEVQLDLPALEQLAELCGVDTVDLMGRLRQVMTR